MVAPGALGVWTGSVWLATEEAEANPVVRERSLPATRRWSASLDRVRPARQVVLDMVEEYAEVAASFAQQVAEIGA